MKKIILILSIFCHTIQGYEESVSWTKEKTEIAQIQVEKAGPGEICTKVQVPGKIIFHPDRIAYVIPKVGGMAQVIYKNLGDQVEKGDILAILESKEMAEAKSLYLVACKKLDYKRMLLSREEDLVGISPEQDLLEARLEVQEALINADLAKQNLLALGLTEEDILHLEGERWENLRYYPVKSPIMGKIVQRNLTLGEYVSNATKIYSVANFEKVWIEISVCQKDTHCLKKQQLMEIISPDGKKACATLHQFDPVIQEETRRATAIAVIDNPSGFWKVGEYVTAQVQTGSHFAPVMVPKMAIQLMHDEPTIYVDDNDRFVARHVILGLSDENNVEILSGLQVGELYAATNAFVIKAEMEKEASEHSH